VQTTDVSVVVDTTTNDTIKSVKRKESVGAKIKRVFTLGKGDKKKAIEQQQQQQQQTATIETPPATNGDITHQNDEIKATIEVTTPEVVVVEVTKEVTAVATTEPEPIIETTTTKQQELTLTATEGTEQTAVTNTTAAPTTDKNSKHHCIIV